jgi:DNA polymerase-3 subunit alpha
MTEVKRETSKVKYVGLHAHSVAGSPFDALGYPQEHMESAYNNGMDALALTDHGNMNGLAYQVLHAKKMQEKGKDFKPIYGCEAYFVPSLQEWHREKGLAELDKKRAKKDAKATGTTVEDENASKSAVKDILSRRSHLILIATNQKGLSNLFEMVSKSYTPENFYRYPRIDFDTLAEHSEGIIVSSACMGGVFASDYWKNREAGEEAVLEAMHQTASRFKEIFGGNFYGEIQWNAIPDQHAINKFVIKVCGELDIELVSTSDSHYPNKEVWKDRELYRKLGWLRTGLEEATLPESIDETRCELYPKNGDEMVEAIRKYSNPDNWIYHERDTPVFPSDVEYDEQLMIDSVERTYQIAHEKVENFFPDNTVRLPDFVIPEGSTADEALCAAANRGLEFRGLKGNKQYEERLAQEFDVISSRGFSTYFLTMKAISDKAQQVQLVGAGRGSAAGSLIAFCLEITQIDPIKYNLQFERFLRKDAVDYPDIDYDVGDPMALKDMLIDEWGDNVVVPISNWNTLQLRSLIKDISKFYSIDYSEVNQVTSRMMSEALPKAKEANGIVAGVYTPTFKEVMDYSESLKGFLNKYPHVKTHVLRIFGSVRSCSRHAGGVLVGENLDKHMPLIASGGVRQTPWSEGQNVRHLEPMGFIKFDILGLASLRMIEGAIRHILVRKEGIANPTFEDIKKYYDTHLDPNVVDFADESVWEKVFHKGKWAGIFQFTQPGAQNFCKEVKPNNLVDLAAITAIYRPGPLSAGVAKKYTKAKASPEDIEYGHPIIKECLEDTYGFIIFQEQLALLAHKLGRDISLDEGNMLRKLLTKKGTGKGAETLEVIRIKFIDGCVDKGITERQAMQLWEKMEFFSGYGFNASHAVSYATLSYQCAWLLRYYPIEWVAAFLDKEPEGRKEAAINIAKNLGFSIEALNVNTSGRVWDISADGNALIQPLTAVKGLGDSAIEQIYRGRPFHKIEDFLFNENMVYSKLNKKALDVLVRSQALNSLMDDRFTGLKHYWSSVAVERPRKEKDLEDNIVAYAPEGDFSIEEKIEYLTDLTGVFPMSLVVNDEIQGKLKDYAVPAISDYDPDLNLVWFIPRKVTSRKTKNGKTYWVIEVIDENNALTHIKCWGIKEGRDNVHINHPYMAKLDYDPNWGFSTRSIYHNFRMLG